MGKALKYYGKSSRKSVKKVWDKLCEKKDSMGKIARKGLRMYGKRVKIVLEK